MESRVKSDDVRDTSLSLSLSLSPYIYIYVCVFFFLKYLYLYLLYIHTRTRTHTHTLAQTCLIEFWCGMHLSRKNTSVTPDRRVWCGVEGKFLRRHLEEKNEIKRSHDEESYNIRKKWNGQEVHRSLRLHQRRRKINQKSPSSVHVPDSNSEVILVEKRHGGSWVSHIRLHSNLDGSSLAHARAEKEATVEGCSEVPHTHTHTHTLPQQGLFGRPQAVVVLMPYVGGEVGSAGSDWQVGGYESSLRWLQSGKLLRKHGRLMSKRLKPATWQSAVRRNTTWSPRPKFTVTWRCRAENVQLGKGHSCDAAEARRRMAAKEHDGR